MKKGIACLILTIMVICASQWTAFGLAEEIQPLSSQELKNKWNINPSVKKIILDTDVCFFGDDVYALHTLLKADELGYVDLCAITTCCGNNFVAGTTYDTLAYLDYVGRQDIPVYMGNDDLLSGMADIEQLQKLCGVISYTGLYEYQENYTDDYLQAAENGLTAWNQSKPTSKPKEQSAADYIIEEIHNHPGEVTVLALGALTNVAQALEKDPSIVEDAAGIIYMGGVFDRWAEEQQKLEYNFWCDPKATNLALSAGWKNQMVVSHDAATTCLRGFDVYQMALKQNHNPFTEFFIDNCRNGCGNDEEIKQNLENGLLYCWDPITVAYILCPEICTVVETRYIWVDDRMGPTYGLTFNWKDGLQPEESYKAEVVLAIDRDQFWQFLFDLSDAK